MNLLPRTAEVDGNIAFEETMSSRRQGAPQALLGVEMTMVFPGSDDLAQPVKRCGERITVLLHHLGDDKATAKKKAIDLLEQVGIPEPSASINTARTLWRPAPTSVKSRTSACLRAVAADRRRTHDCRRRDGTKTPP